jgi:hypothetical protein
VYTGYTHYYLSVQDVSMEGQTAMHLASQHSHASLAVILFGPLRFLAREAASQSPLRHLFEDPTCSLNALSDSSPLR